jgi:hypothetical protein
MFLSVFLSVYNEEVRLPAFLEYHSFCEHFYIAVKKSDDATRELALSYGNVTIIDLPYSKPSGEYENFKSLILPEIQSEWILNLGVSDRLSESLYAQIKKLIHQKDFDVLQLPFKNVIFGMITPKSPFPSLCYKALLCKTSVADFQPKIHNELKHTSKKVMRLHYVNDAIIHYSSVKTDENFIDKIFYYARTEVMQYAADVGLQYHPYVRHPLISSFKILFNGFLRRKTIFDKKNGTFLGLAYVLNHMMIMFVAFYELNRKNEKGSFFDES